MNAQQQISPARGVMPPTPVSIRDLLEWAFQRECASIDFDELGTLSGRTLPRFGTEYRMIMQAQLGCRVDGGGRSERHHDADQVSYALSALPVAYGGPRMALWIADLARSGREPDWMPDAKPVFRPSQTHTNQFGARAETRDAIELGRKGWAHQPRRNRKGRIVHDPVRYTPVICLNGPDQIAAARRDYLRWWGALAELRTTFRVYGGLSCFAVTEAMPPMQPWKKRF